MDELTPEALPEPLPAPPPQPSLLHKIFIGPQGIRAGWGALLFILLFIGIAQAVGRTIHHLRHLPKGYQPPTTLHVLLVSEFIGCCIIVLATWLMALIERRRFTSYGLAGVRKLPLLFTGLFWGFFFISLLVGALSLTHHIAFDPGHAPLHAALKYGAVWGVFFILVGLLEEMMLRGYLQWTLARGLGFWWGALILSFAFGAIHGKNPGESPIGLVSAGAVGLVFCLAIWYTKSLWWAIGAHIGWDWGQTFFYGASDSGLPTMHSFAVSHPAGSSILWSGGATGPEGSVLILPTLLLMSAVIYLTLRNFPAASHD